MFWILLVIAGTVLALVSHVRISIQNDIREIEHINKKDSKFATICVTIAVVAIFIVISQGVRGMKNYPSLVDKSATIKTLQQRIENLQQPTNLSKFILDLAILEAAYNGQLERCKVYKKEFPLYFFGNGWAISDKVLTLERISK